jgi:pimeloyl-ACP methyl ester carboxylesterase
MTEHAVRFGPWGSSVGVVSLPEDGAAAPGSPAVLFLNAGLLRHAGPHRLHVLLARRLARAGLTALRFDLSRIGDSGSRQDRLSRDESIVVETRDAMDFLSESYGVRRFLLFGLCSGADQAVRTALEDERVVGAVLVDGYAYPTWRFKLRHYATRMFRPSSWWSVLSLRHPVISRLTNRGRAPDTELAPEPAGPRLGVYDRPRQDVAEARLLALTQRGCRLFLAFTPSRHFNRASQLAEMFPALAKSERVQGEYFEHANHMFTLQANQEDLMTRVEAWIGASVNEGAASRSLEPA